MPAEAPPAPAAPAVAPAAEPASLDAAPVQVSDHYGAELDALDAADKAPPKERTNRGQFKPKDATKPSDPTPVTEPKPADAAEPKPGEPAKPAEPVKPVKAADLRAAYDQSKAKVKELETAHSSLQAKFKELETRQPVDVKPLEGQIAALTKERDELRDEIRYVNYTKHPEYQDKYEKPYLAAWNKAVGEVTQLTIETEEGSTRKATVEDLLALANSPLDQIDDLAEKWFGKSAQRAIRHVEKLKELAEARDTALHEARSKAGEREKMTSQQLATRREKLSGLYQQTAKQLQTKYPQWFSPIEGDAEGNTLLEKGDALVQSVFDHKNSLTEEQRTERLVTVQQQARAFPRTVLMLNRAKARIRELEESLKAYEGSEPAATGGEPGATNGKSYLDDAMAEIDTLNKS
jgi:hypothetical protein